MRAQRGPLLQDLTRMNPWWTQVGWESSDPQLVAASHAPYERRPTVLDDISPPNLYTLRGPRRTGKSTLLKQRVAGLIREGIAPQRIVYFAVDALSNFTDLINLFQAARLLFPDLAGLPRYFLIDEVTSIPEWQRGLKWVRDNTAAAGDCIVATGSSARDVAAGTAFLAGRRGPTSDWTVCCCRCLSRNSPAAQATRSLPHLASASIPFTLRKAVLPARTRSCMPERWLTRSKPISL